MPQSNDNMTFGDHLEDLRKRIVLALIVPLPILVISLILGDRLLAIIVRPLTASLVNAGATPTLIATSPFETFGAYLKVGFVVAILVSFPWILYQLWQFIAPGLYATERRFVYFFIPLSTVLTIAATAFLYYILLPISLTFLISFGQSVVERPSPTIPYTEELNIPTIPILQGTVADAPAGSMYFDRAAQTLNIQIDPETVMRRPFATGTGAVSQDYRIGEYINLVFMLGIAFTLAFQLPIVLLLLSWAGIVNVAQLARARKFAAFACAVAGAIFTPQDPISMLLLAAALYLLFELSLLLIRFVTPARVAGKPQQFDLDE